MAGAMKNISGGVAMLNSSRASAWLGADMLGTTPRPA